MTEHHWEPTRPRFVAFFDILGFKDLVQRNTHEYVLEKLYFIKSSISRLEKASNNPAFTELQMDDDQTRGFTFSDSITLYSKSDQAQDLIKIIYDAHAIMRWSMESGIPIKGALAYGKVTVDFDSPVFFGQPFIDSYLLHEELQMMTCILHHSIEAKFKAFALKGLQPMVTDYRVFLRSGRVTHTVIRPHDERSIEMMEEHLRKMYSGVSGRPRIYIDNTLEYLSSLKAI